MSKSDSVFASDRAATYLCPRANKQAAFCSSPSLVIAPLHRRSSVGLSCSHLVLQSVSSRARWRKMSLNCCVDFLGGGMRQSQAHLRKERRKDERFAMYLSRRQLSDKLGKCSAKPRSSANGSFSFWRAACNTITPAVSHCTCVTLRALLSRPSYWLCQAGV